MSWERSHIYPQTASMCRPINKSRAAEQRREEKRREEKEKSQAREEKRKVKQEKRREKLSKRREEKSQAREEKRKVKQEKRREKSSHREEKSSRESRGGPKNMFRSRPHKPSKEKFSQGGSKQPRVVIVPSSDSQPLLVWREGW